MIFDLGCFEFHSSEPFGPACFDLASRKCDPACRSCGFHIVFALTSTSATWRHLKTSLFACAAVCQVAPTHIHRHGDLLSRLVLYKYMYIYIFFFFYNCTLAIPTWGHETPKKMFCSHVSRAIPTNIVSLKTLRAKPTGNTGKFCGADVSLTCIPILLKRSGLHQHKCDHSASAKGLQPPKRITTNRM